MIEKGTLLGKKRKKIFFVEKQKKNENDKKIQSKDYYKLNTTQNTYKKIKKNVEIDKSKTKEGQCHSLIGISKLVLEFIKKKEKKTGNQITEYIQNVLQTKKDDKTIQKNIQRRVYDAINVMSAIGIIQKDRQDIKYIPFKEEDNDNKEQILEKSDDDIELKNREYLEKLREVNFLQKILIKKFFLLKFFEKNFNINNNNNDKNKIENFQQKLIITENHQDFDDKNSKEHIHSNSLINDLPIYNYIKKIIAPELLEKLVNQRSIDDKENNNKGNNIIRIVNNDFYISNDKTEFKIKYNSDEKPSIDIKEINNNDDIVFDYLKNLKIFKNELFSVFNDIDNI